MKKALKRQNQRPSGPSFGVTGPEMEARRKGRLITSSILKKERIPLRVIDVVEQANGIAEEALANALALDPQTFPSACQPGCAWCCYKVVGTMAPEVFRIANYLRKTLSKDVYEATLTRIIRSDEERRKLHPDERTKARPCSLLEDGRCIAYPTRPLTCRGFNSSDAHQCELSLEPRNKVRVPAYQPQQRLYTLVLDGVRSGLDESGLSGELLELTGALRIALSADKAEEQWLAGKDVFSQARLN